MFRMNIEYAELTEVDLIALFSSLIFFSYPVDLLRVVVVDPVRPRVPVADHGEGVALLDGGALLCQGKAHGLDLPAKADGFLQAEQGEGIP